VRERERERESAGKRERARKEEEVNEMVGGRVYQRRCREGAGGFKIIGWEVKGFSGCLGFALCILVPAAGNSYWILSANCCRF
jgi:hypothetical protein